MSRKYYTKYKQRSKKNCNIVTKRTSNITIQRLQIQKQDNNRIAVQNKYTRLQYIDNSRIIILQQELQDILFDKHKLCIEEQ